MPGEGLPGQSYVDRAVERKAEAGGLEGERVAIELLPAAARRGNEPRQARTEHIGNRPGEGQGQGASRPQSASRGGVGHDSRPRSDNEPRDANGHGERLPTPCRRRHRQRPSHRCPRGDDAERNDRPASAKPLQSSVSDRYPAHGFGEADRHGTPAPWPKQGRTDVSDRRHDRDRPLSVVPDEPSDPTRPANLDLHRYARSCRESDMRPDDAVVQRDRQRLAVRASH